jgi:murein DD-endopeptidase MepM/ murein hydrolase activator NlpD
MKLRHLLLSTITLLTLTACAQSKFTALEQQQISIEDAALFEKSEAFTIDFAALREQDYSFPLPVGKAKMGRDYLVEIDTKKGDAVKAMFGGTVRLSKYNPSFGNIVVVRHDNGLETIYGNNAENLVKSGDHVKAGQTIAIVGSSNGRTYCVFGIMVNGSRINPEIIFSLQSHQLRRQTVLCRKAANWKVDVSVLKEPRPDEALASQWWCYPLPGAKVISPFGARGGRRHTGTDLKTKPNDNILAAFDGDVVFSGPYAAYGNLIRIKHNNGLETYYSHNSKNLVKVGDKVKAGQVIALTGRTGRATTEHLHFETRVNGQAVNSNKYFDHQNHTIRLKVFKKTSNGYVAR